MKFLDESITLHKSRWVSAYLYLSPGDWWMGLRHHRSRAGIYHDYYINILPAVQIRLEIVDKDWREEE